MVRALSPRRWMVVIVGAAIVDDRSGVAEVHEATTRTQIEKPRITSPRLSPASTVVGTWHPDVKIGSGEARLRRGNPAHFAHHFHVQRQLFR